MELTPQNRIERYLDTILHRLKRDGGEGEVDEPRTRLEAYLYFLCQDASNFWDYEEIEYIGLINSSGQYIDTGVIANQDTEFDITFYLNTIPNRHSIFGARKGSGNQELQLTPYNAGILRFDGREFAIKFPAKEIIVSSLHDRVWKVNDEQMDVDGEDFETPCTITLFALNNNGGLVQFSANTNVYNFKLYDGKKMIRDFIPVLWHGFPCMYEKVEDKFYLNQGAGQFIAGLTVNQ